MTTGNNNDPFLLYLLEESALTPEEEKLARQQQYVDALRTNAFEPRRGQMVGRTYVAPGFGEYAAQIGNALMARSGAKKLYGQDGESGSVGQLQSKRIELVKNLRNMLNPKRMGVPIPTKEEDEFYNRVGSSPFSGY